ncbi:pentatricopeptide repeat-containing protein At5g02830, chloroplastic isoform X2 [Magnolia sinica]|uniref:pentatricopeptide repeat-containing protein At5g02830, chloroplastic isoform X2 n=1 Tax=Magnolia sinica TaxID=86752 RepID=UPI002659E49C|nr:pentatricopeptide repeat-containing protein At5g02830, chloroplastic isoform X2 [Magnolia sinica]
MREVQLLLITAASSSFLLPSHHPSLNRTKTSASERPWPFLLHNARSLLMPGHGTRLKYYATESSMVAESLLASTSSPVDVKLMSAGISGSLREGKIRAIVEILGRVEKLGICPLSLFDGSARELLRLECCRLVDGGRLDEFVELVEILAGYGFSIKDLVEPIAIIRMCVERRDPHMAVRYTSILPHSHILFSSIIHEFGKKKDLESALIVFNESKEKLDAPNMYVCRSMIDICGLCGDSLRSRCIFEAIGVTADVASYNILLKACRLAGRVDLAQDIYKEVMQMESTGALKLDIITYSTIIKVFADAKMWQMALKIKEEMLYAGVNPNIVTWSSLVSAFANAGLVEKAVQVFEEMLHAGCEPNSQCCNILLSACVESCQYDRAFRFFRSWMTSGFQKAHTKVRNRNAFSHIGMGVEHASKNGVTQMSCNVDQHHSCFTNVVGFKPTIATYNILMKACGTDYYHAKALMDEMRTVGLYPNHISWSILIDICGGSHNMRGAMQAFKAMRDAGISPDVVAYTTAIKDQVSGKIVTKGPKVGRLFPLHFSIPSCISLACTTVNNKGEACVQNKNLKIAFSLFEEMKRYQLKPNLVTYNTLLRARSRYGSLYEVQQCLAIYQDMRRAGYSSNDYFLKELLEEWCEGVIKDSGKGLLGLGKSSNKTNAYRSQSLLLEKVAVLLQKDIAKGLLIDLQGLTKVEARIVILAVLRMIKESYIKGLPIKDDMIIITGVEIEVLGSANNEPQIRAAVIKVLRNELGLDVLAGSGNELVRNDPTSPPNSSLVHGILRKHGYSSDLKFSTRRPPDLGRLMVPRKSLRNWLQKRICARR